MSKNYAGHPDQHYGATTYSQHGEDLFIVNLFRLIGIDKPRYLDVGAHHPVDISNTKLLYDRGSRGVNVEANPNLIEAFKFARPEDLTLNVGVGVEAGAMPFYMYDERSGRNTFSKDEIIEANLNRPIKQTINVGVVTLPFLLDEYGPFDFLSIDIEGLDYAVLQSTELLRYNIAVICVETRLTQIRNMVGLLNCADYYYIARLGENLIFLESEHLNAYRGWDTDWAGLKSP